MSEELRFGLELTVIGVSIVLGVLWIITGSVSLIRLVDQRWQANEKRAEEEATEREPTIDSTTLVLIAAACATMIQGRFYIRRVRRLMPSTAQTGVWSMQGRAILHGSHVIPKKR
ncbi:MAG: OadG family protein [candidate division Zixibacteria bacterium]|jgi:Na+-transporting methylmalonyl-CoA/oxaloacetate decarboxylase gamma subunit|nr:OadG family protein [candidate division Zixibacteria bacterium]